jgi:glycosyltransferase involved in cell wall biosynthesis
MSSRIVVFLPSLRGGGAERAIAGVCNGLVAGGVEVVLVLADLGDGTYRSEIDSRVRVIALARGGVFDALLPLADVIRREQPAAVLSAMRHANVIAILAHALASRGMSVAPRLVISERVEVAAMRALESGLRARVVHWLARRLYRRAHSVIAVSAGVEAGLRVELGNRAPEIRVIYNPTVTPALREGARAAVPHPWLEAGEPPVILGVGRLTAQKGFDVLIDAFASVRSTRPCRLILLGEGPDRAALEKQAERRDVRDDVLMPGFVENPYVWMAHTSAFVLSSRAEGLPNALIQAMACGAPLVSTDCPSGPREILEYGRWGRLVQVDNTGAIAQAIAEVLDERPLSAPDAALRRFTPEFVIAGYADALGVPFATARSGDAEVPSREVERAA